MRLPSKPSAAVSICALALLAAACGSSVNPPNPRLPPSSGDGGTSRPDVGAPSGHVQVTIISPGEGSTLSTNGPISISATIQIVDGTDFIDPNTVKTRLTPASSTTPASQGTLVGPIGSDSYRGDLSTAGLKQGQYVLSVSAATTSGTAGEAHVDVSIDNGPQLVVVTPVPGGHYKGGVIVQLVTDGPVTDLEGTVGGLPLMFTATGQDNMGQDNQYRAVVDFQNQMPPLRDEQLLRISAKNSLGTRSEIRFLFDIDENGPAITRTLPAPGTVLPPVVRIAAQIQDGAGLNQSSIQAIIRDDLGNQYKLALNQDADGLWSTLFDTHTFPACRLDQTSPCIVFPTLSFRAADLLGNETVLTYEVAFDSIPPIADLTPPMIRDSKIDTGLRCSFAFDPLSNNILAGDMPDDGCLVPQIFDLRARVEDDGNKGVDVKLVPIAGVDPDATAVYVLDDVSQPLVVDTDGDGYCDDVNPKLAPTTNPPTSPRQVLKVRLAPVPQKGHADFTPDPTLPATLPSPLGCIRGKDDNSPTPLCPGNQPTVAITYAGQVPAVWSLQPIEDDRFCFGPQFDTFANHIGEGWKCIAVVTKDLNGNASTSAPLRVYVSYNYGGAAPTWCSSKPANPPSCTGIYDRKSDQVTPGPCKTRNFLTSHQQPEICFNGECY